MLQTLKSAELVADLLEYRMIVHLKVVVDNPVSKERPLSYDIELSRMDAERGFVESQEQEETLLAVISGGEMSASIAGAGLTLALALALALA